MPFQWMGSRGPKEDSAIASYGKTPGLHWQGTDYKQGSGTQVKSSSPAFPLFTCYLLTTNDYLEVQFSPAATPVALFSRSPHISVVWYVSR